jgi:uncharacterized protein YcbK (DUF882 family)
MSSLFSNRYFPHALFAIALTSISINLISHRRTAEEERSRIQAQISVLESIKKQLQSDEPLSNEELEKLKKLVRPVDVGKEVESQKKEEISWTNVFRRKPQVSDGEPELSKWDQQDLEKCA